MQRVKEFFQDHTILSQEAIAQAGSDRSYQRIRTNKGSYIICHSTQTAESQTFLYFAKQFSQLQLPVPEILYVSEDFQTYVQTDGGQEDLLHHTLTQGHTPATKLLYEKALSQLSHLQIAGDAAIDYSRCFTTSNFDHYAVQADLNYFKYYFLDLAKIKYNRLALQEEFERWSQACAQIEPRYFMYRDFQGRNILVKDNELTFIDFQGGMKGPVHYDVASLLWQAKAKLPLSWKQELLEVYLESLAERIPVDKPTFHEDYGKILLTRLLQVLGAYGLRGLIEKRPHFITSIPFGLENIREWLSIYSIPAYPELTKILEQLASDDCLSRFKTHTVQEEKKLNIRVQSFSYKQGLPVDESGNGGGFIFDCRGILNPGRFEEYKELTGRDQAVIEFLEAKTKMPEFLQATKDIVSISIDDYLARGFEHLQINFGCTGGQHRSVYCAEKLSQFIQEKYKITPTILHIEQVRKGRWK